MLHRVLSNIYSSKYTEKWITKAQSGRLEVNDKCAHIMPILQIIKSEVEIDLL